MLVPPLVLTDDSCGSDHDGNNVDIEAGGNKCKCGMEEDEDKDEKIKEEKVEDKETEDEVVEEGG